MNAAWNNAAQPWHKLSAFGKNDTGVSAHPGDDSTLRSNHPPHALPRRCGSPISSEMAWVSGHEPDDMPEHRVVGWQHPSRRVEREAVWAVVELVEIAPVADVPMAGPFDLSGRLGGRRAGRPIERADSARPGRAAARRSRPRCCSSCCPSGGPSASVCSGAAGRGIRIRLDLVDAIAETAGVPQGPLRDDLEELRAGHLQPRHARERKQTRSRQALHEPSSMTFVIATTFVIAEPNLYATTTADRELQGHDVYKSDRTCQPT